MTEFAALVVLSDGRFATIQAVESWDSVMRRSSETDSDSKSLGATLANNLCIGTKGVFRNRR